MNATKKTFGKNFLKDFIGAFGDTPTFIPLAMAMVLVCGFSPTAVFLPAGILYIVAGVFYRVPVPVQPLKAIAAISIAGAIKPEVVAASAFLMALFMLIFVIFNFSRYLDKIFTKPLIRGIQFGVGILLIMTGIRLIFKNEILSGVFLPDVNFTGFHFGPSPVSISFPTYGDFITALFVLFIPQIPLTIGNAIVAVGDLEKDYFGERASRVTYSNLAKTIGIGNLLAGIISGMPVCHGSGGLTAHYNFGARTGRANIVIGITYLVIAVLFARMSTYLLSSVPLYVFGVLLLYIGAKHALLARDQKRLKNIVIVLTMGIITLFYKNLTISLVAGLILRGLFDYISYLRKLKASNLSR